MILESDEIWHNHHTDHIEPTISKFSGNIPIRVLGLFHQLNTVVNRSFNIGVCVRLLGAILVVVEANHQIPKREHSQMDQILVGK